MPTKSLIYSIVKRSSFARRTLHNLVSFFERLISRGYRSDADRKLLSKVNRFSRSWLTPVESHLIMSFAKYYRDFDADMAEVGVSNGSSARLICEMKGDVPLHLFDTFCGLPEANEIDEGFFQKGMFSAELEKVKKFLRNYKSVHFHPGIFPETAGRITDRKFSFVFLDVDLYDSTKHSLEFFSSRMVPGGMLVSHDYQFPGVKQAFIDTGFETKTIELANSMCMVLF